MVTIPSKGDQFRILIEHLRLAQEASAMLAHLNNADGDASGMVIGRGWLHVEDNLKKMVNVVTTLATRGLQ